jgi:predicted dehydrogenase
VTSAKIVHIGLIGGGNISETHARAAKAISGTDISAIYGTNSDKVRKLSSEFGAKAYGNFDDFLSHRPMDMVAIGSPSGLHATHGIAAATQGLHVLTEKPIDISSHRAGELVVAVKQSGVKLGVIFQDRGKPEIRKLKQWIDRGVLGKLVLIDAKVKWYRPPEYYAHSKWRGTLALDGGGALVNQAIHTIDLLLWLFGDVTKVQSSVSTTLHKIEGEDTVVAIMHFANGAIGSLVATTSAFPGYPRRLEITGTEGTIILEQDQIVVVDLKNAPPDVGAASRSGDMENISSPIVSDYSPHKVIIEDFIQAIAADSKPMCDGVEGLRSISLVEKIYAASDERIGNPRI